MKLFTLPEKALALDALDESIAHWERLRDGREREVTEHYWDRSLTRLESPKSDDCACCQQYNTSNCTGCPIAIYVGGGDCRGTPYYRAADAYRDARRYGRATDETAIDAQVVFLEVVKEWVESQ